MQERADDAGERVDALPRLQLDEGEEMTNLMTWQSGRLVRNFGIIHPMKALAALFLIPRTALDVTVPPLPFDDAVPSETR